MISTTRMLGTTLATLTMLNLSGVLGIVSGSASAPQTPPPGGKSPAPSVTAEELGVSIDRIRARFQKESTLEHVFDPARLVLTTYVDVAAKAPPLRLFGPDVKRELTSRAVPFGAPTHQDMLTIMTPQEFRTPPMDLTALLEWLVRRLDGKKSESE